MTEPTSTASAGFGLGALAVALAGPLAGPYLVIVAAAITGALWPLGEADTKTRTAGFWLLLRCTLTAVILTHIVAQLIERTYQIPVLDSMGPVALLIGAMGNGWRPVFGALGAALSALLARVAGGPKQ